MIKSKRWNAGIAFTLSICLFLTSCASSSKSPAKTMEHPGVRTFSPEEIEFGTQVHQNIVSSFYLYTEPSLTDYVKRVGVSLAGDIPESREHYHFTVLYNDKIYATAAPGGWIYITTGLLNFLDSEAELAAVLAHEMAALQFQDPRHSNGRKTMEGVAQTVAMVGPAFGQIGSLAALGVILLHSATQAGETSKADRLILADQLALRYMLYADYDPQGMIDFFYRFLQADQSTLPFFYDYYQSHPLTEERINRLHQDFSNLPMGNRQLVMRRGEFQEATRGVREMYAL